MHPSFSIGAEIEHWHKNNSVAFQTIEISYYNHKMIGAGTTINTSIGYRYNTKSGFFFESMLGIGTTIYNPAHKNFVLNKNGEYETNNNPLKTMFAFPMDIGLGYQNGNFLFYTRYRYMIEHKYIEKLPTLPTSSLSIGIKYKLKTKDKTGGS